MTMIKNKFSKLSKKARTFIAILCCVGMTAGIFAETAAFQVKAATISASEKNYYNVAYGTNDGSVTLKDGTAISVINQTRKENEKEREEAVYIFDGNVWSSKEPNKFVVWDGKGENTFRAIYPYTAEYAAFTIPQDQSSEENLASADWMTAVCSTANRDDVNLQFSHLLTKVTVKIIAWNNEFDGTEDVTEVKFYSKGTELSAAYDGDNKATVSTQDASLKEIMAFADETEKSYTAIIKPGSYDSGEKFMSLKVGDNDILEVHANETLIDGLEPGCHYTFNITVGKDKVELSEVIVNNWSDGGTIEGGTVEEFPFVYSVNNTVVTVTLPDTSNEKIILDAVPFLDTSSFETMILNGEVSPKVQKAIAEVLKGKSVTVFMPNMEKANLVSELTSSGLTLVCGYIETKDSDGNVTGYTVYNADGLISWNTAAQDNLSLNLTLAKDIILNSSGDSNWTSVGNESSPYIGTVDGAGYSISNLKINQQAMYAGFIGYLGNSGGKSGAVKNLTLREVSIKNTKDYTGGIAGCYNANVIENCHVVGGSITSTNQYVGGIVGRICDNKSIIACSNSATISSSGSMLVGGIAGFTTTRVGECHVYGCYNSGSCSAKEGYVGGIYGAMKSSYIRGCYSTNSGLYGKSYNYTQPLQNSYTTDILKHKDDMNNELKYWGINYEYVENTDEATKDTMPLVIRKK